MSFIPVTYDEFYKVLPDDVKVSVESEGNTNTTTFKNAGGEVLGRVIETWEDAPRYMRPTKRTFLLNQKLIS
jgi:hypothetical protein